MIDFFNNLPPENKEKKLRIIKTRVTHINVELPELAELKNNLSSRMKVTLPQSGIYKPQPKLTPESQRVRRGETTTLF